MKKNEDDDLIVLVRKEKKIRLNIKEEPKKKKIKKKKKFKTGGKENKNKNLLKSLSKAIPPKNVQEFHESKLTNMIIYGEGLQELYRFKGVPSDKILHKIVLKHDNVFVLVNIGSDIFKQVSVKSYLALKEIKKIRLSRRVIYINNDSEEMCEEDSKTEDCEFEVYNQVENVFSINKLLQVIFTDCIWSDAIIFLTSTDYWYQSFEKEYKLLVDTGKDTIDLYDNLDNFKKDYKLR